MKEGLTGVTNDTPKRILFGAGTIHRNLKKTGKEWNFNESIVGATNGGSTLTITPEIYNVPVDGPNIKIKELTKKVGEEATLAVNFVEMSDELIQAAALARAVGRASSDGSTEDGYELIESKQQIDDSDFWENIAFVGQTLEGKNIIAILDNALVTSGLPLAGSNRTESTTAMTFTCHAGIEDLDIGTLPWHIYYPEVEME